jgi:hypothetical protein
VFFKLKKIECYQKTLTRFNETLKKHQRNSSPQKTVNFNIFKISPINRDTFEASGYIQRHSGVLGLCAFINAFPYEIPEFIPFVFEHLSYNLNDPLPISSTIRKTLSDFKRTHDFTEIQLKFNEKQMELFEVNPPSYYA